MTYAELFDKAIDEQYQDQFDKIWFLRGIRPSVVMREHSETDYNCTFNNWTDGLDSPMLCPECLDHDIDAETLRNGVQEDEVQCDVCAGTHFVCEECGELLPITAAVAEGSELCQSCQDERETDDE